MDHDLLQWFVQQTRRVGERQALELLCVALGVDTPALDYVRAYFEAECRLRDEAEAYLDLEFDRADQVKLAMEQRGVDHLVWVCPGCPERERHRCHMWDIPYQLPP